MTPFEMGQATARFTIMLMREASALKGAECKDGHLFFTYCPCADCVDEVEQGYFPGISCTLCGEPFDDEGGEDDGV